MIVGEAVRRGGSRREGAGAHARRRPDGCADAEALRIEAAGHIKDLLPHAKILMLTISDDEGDLYDAIKAGAAGYLLKEIPIDEVADAIRSVWAGQSRISPSMASKLLTEFAAISKEADERPQMPRAQAHRPRDGGPSPRRPGAQQP